MSKVLVILGMHRSGTSLVTQWLNKCGLDVGEDLLDASSTNVEGHFEDNAFLKLHSAILYANNLPESGMTDADVNVDRTFLQKIKNLCLLKSFANDQWGFKEPRTCLLLAAYRQLFPEFKYIVIVRNFTDVVDSLIRRDVKYMEDYVFENSAFKERLFWKIRNKKRTYQKLAATTSETYLKIWIKYNQELLKHISKIHRKNYIVVGYNKLLFNSTEVLQFLKSNWHFELNAVDFRTIYKEHLMSGSNKKRLLVRDNGLLRKAHSLYQNLIKYLL